MRAVSVEYLNDSLKSVQDEHGPVGADLDINDLPELLGSTAELCADQWKGGQRKSWYVGSCWKWWAVGACTDEDRRERNH